MQIEQVIKRDKTKRKISLPNKHIKEWFECKEQLTKLKAKEMKMRVSIIDRVIFEQGKNNADISTPVFDLKATKKFSWKYDQDKIHNLILQDSLSEKEMRSIKVTYSPVMKEYKKLSKNSAIVEAMTCSASAPSLTVISKSYEE